MCCQGSAEWERLVFNKMQLQEAKEMWDTGGGRSETFYTCLALIFTQKLFISLSLFCYDKKKGGGDV